jgi:putative ABC transport system permease protein
MSLWRQLSGGLRALLHPKSVDQEVADEIRDYLDQTTAALVDTGFSLDDARRRARSELGDATLVRQHVRSRGWESIFAPLLADLRFAIRQLRLTPAFVFMSVVILALSIGGCTAIFSAFYAVLLKPLPYPDGHQVMMIWEEYSKQHPIAVAFGTFQGLERQNRSFESMAALKPWQPVLVHAGHTERLVGQQVSASYFHVLAASPLLGRAFIPSDDEPDAAPVVIFSEQIWRTQLAASPSILGQQVMLDGIPHTVIGVMPHSFENVLSPSAGVWTPLRYDPLLPADGKEWGHHLRVVGRLHDGVNVEQATFELNGIFHELKQRLAKGYAGSGGPSYRIAVDALQKDISLRARPALLAIFSAALVLILLACVNVTDSLLMHGIQRQNGLSMRTAPKANPYRAMRQVFLESFILAALGGFLGMGIAQAGIKGLAMIIPPGLPRANGISLNHATFLFLIGITGILGILLGIVPGLAIYRRHRDGEAHLKVAEPIRATRLNHGPFIAVQVALAFTLLVGTGLLLYSRQVLSRVNPGFEASHLLTLQGQDPMLTRRSARAHCEMLAHTLDAIRKVPGVVSAGMTSQLPLSGERDVYGIQFEKQASLAGDAAFRYTVMPGYIETMGISLRQGRLFSGRDLGEDAQKVVIINESFSAREFAGQDPIGQHVRVGLDVGHADRSWATVVGVVSDVKQESLSENEEDEFYVPASQWPWADRSPWLVIRTVRDAESFAPAIRRAVWSVNPTLTINRVDTMDHLVTASKDEQRFVLILFGSFGVMGVVLLLFGIYDVLSGSTTQHIRDVDGRRSALLWKSNRGSTNLRERSQDAQYGHLR